MILLQFRGLSIFNMAITRDVTSTGNGNLNNSGGNITISHNNSGNLLLVFVQTSSPGGGFPTPTVTYNGVSMTMAVNNGGGGQNSSYLFVLKNPATGTHNIVVSENTAGSDPAQAIAVSYNNTNTGTEPDITTTSSSNASSFATSLTTTRDADWAALFVINIGDTNTPWSAGTNSTAVNANHISGVYATALFDTQGYNSGLGIIPAGSFAMTVTNSDTTKSGKSIMVAFYSGDSIAQTANLSDSIMNGASRSVSLAKSQALIRAFSDSILNGAGRLVSLATIGELWHKITKSISSWTNQNRD